jgi:hypothetical protein
LERLTLAWTKGRISSLVYEQQAADLEAQLAEEPPPPATPEQKLDLILALREVRQNLRSTRSPEEGALVNRILRQALVIGIAEDRSATVTLRSEYAHWAA